MSPPCRVELDSLIVIDPRDIRKRGNAKAANRHDQNFRLNILRLPIPRPEMARPDVASSVPLCTDKLGVALNVWAEFIFVGEVEPVALNLSEASKEAAPVGVLVFRERVPMGANVTRTALSSSPRSNENGVSTKMGR